MSNSEQGRDNEKMEDVAPLLCGRLRPGFQSRPVRSSEPSQPERWRDGAVCTRSWLFTYTAVPVILTHKNSRTGKLSPVHTWTQMSTCMHTVWMNSGMKKRQNVGVEVVKANPAGHLVFFIIFLFNKCLLKDLHQMKKRSWMRYDCADVAQWIRELWRLMEILEEPGLHVLWRRGRQAGQDPKNM